MVVNTNGQSNVGIRGPGAIQRFRGDGILFNATVRGWVQGVTTSTNCMSGIRIGPTSTAISVESNVAVRSGTPAFCAFEIFDAPVSDEDYLERWRATFREGSKFLSRV